MPQFSIRTLLLVTAYVALLTILGTTFGAGAPLTLIMITALFACFYHAHRSNKAAYFYMCFVAMAMLPMLPLHLPTRFWSDAEAIFSCISLGFGTWLSLAAIRRGHWCTKIFGILVILPYVSGVIEILVTVWRSAVFFRQGI